MAACFHPPLRDGSLNSKAENGVASYPMVITVDNYDGTLMTGSYVDYSLVASENDNCLVLPIQCVKSVPLEDGSNGNVVFVKGDRPDNAIELSVEVAGVPEGFWPVQVEIGCIFHKNTSAGSVYGGGTVYAVLPLVLELQIVHADDVAVLDPHLLQPVEQAALTQHFVEIHAAFVVGGVTLWQLQLAGKAAVEGAGVLPTVF